MSTYVPLGSRTVEGIPDPTGRNSGKWTVVFDPPTISCNLPYFEVCHIVIEGAIGSSFTVFIEAAQWDTNQNGNANSWDPSVPMPLRPGQNLYFFWSDPDTDNTPPQVTIWLRYDQDIRANLVQLLGQGNS